MGPPRDTMGPYLGSTSWNFFKTRWSWSSRVWRSLPYQFQHWRISWRITETWVLCAMLMLFQKLVGGPGPHDPPFQLPLENYLNVLSLLLITCYRNRGEIILGLIIHYILQILKTRNLLKWWGIGVSPNQSFLSQTVIHVPSKGTCVTLKKT